MDPKPHSPSWIGGAKAVQKAIISHDVSFFTSVPRLGTKNAQKIIIELKNKLGSTADFDLSNDVGETTSLIDALKSMGFESKNIRDVIGQLPADASIEEKNKTGNTNFRIYEII